MKQTVVSSQYLVIALDLATRIAKGELAEGARIYGRSVMASEYNVSPETIRRALRLLADMKVVEVKPQSGAVVLSADNARRYIENFAQDSDARSLYKHIRSLLHQSGELNRQLEEAVTALVKGRDTFSAAARTGFDQNRIPDPVRFFGRLSGRNEDISAGNSGDAGIFHQSPCCIFISHLGNHICAGADEYQPVFFTQAGKISIFRQKSISGMNGLSTG